MAHNPLPVIECHRLGWWRVTPLYVVPVPCPCPCPPPISSFSLIDSLRWDYNNVCFGWNEKTKPLYSCLYYYSPVPVVSRAWLIGWEDGPIWWASWSMSKLGWEGVGSSESHGSYLHPNNKNCQVLILWPIYTLNKFKSLAKVIKFGPGPGLGSTWVL